MPLVPLTAAFDAVQERAPGGALGAFNVIQVEHAEALVRAAESVRLPVVLQLSENCVRYHRGLLPVLAATCEIARTAEVPVVAHLDHMMDEELIEQGLAAGATSVMFDGSVLPFADNVARTVAVAARCRAAGATLEAELGEVGGKNGVHSPLARTDPQEAADFVAATGVDALAVAVGSSHAMVERTAAIDTALVARLAEAVDVPLVLHGSSGVPDETIVAAVHAGIRKVNIATHLNRVFTQVVRERLAADRELVDTRIYLGAARDAVEQETARLLDLLALRHNG